MLILFCMIQAHLFSLVNRAARVAAQCEPGQICVGIPLDTDEEPPDPGPLVEIEVVGIKQLKGITTEMAIFACRKVKEPAEDEKAEDQKKSDVSQSKDQHSVEMAPARKPRKKNASSPEARKIVSDKPEKKRSDKQRRSTKKEQPAAGPSSDLNSLAMW